MSFHTAMAYYDFPNGLIRLETDDNHCVAINLVKRFSNTLQSLGKWEFRSIESMNKWIDYCGAQMQAIQTELKNGSITIEQAIVRISAFEKYMPDYVRADLVEDILVRITLDVRLPSNYNEQTIDSGLANVIEQFNGEVIDSKEYEKIIFKKIKIKANTEN